MIASAWNNGQYHSNGAGYGIRFSINDRDKFFKKEWQNVLLKLEGKAEKVKVTIKPSFWKACGELISSDIGLWLIENNKGKWNRGDPPKLKVEIMEDRKFAVSLIPES